MDHRAMLYSPPLEVLPISAAIAAVRLLVGEMIFAGKALVLPITMATARASPNALVRPRMMPVKIPGKAAGSTTCQIICHLVEPSP